jgi:hypothetical protein
MAINPEALRFKRRKVYSESVSKLGQVRHAFANSQNMKVMLANKITIREGDKVQVLKASTMYEGEVVCIGKHWITQIPLYIVFGFKLNDDGTCSGRSTRLVAKTGEIALQLLDLNL